MPILLILPRPGSFQNIGSRLLAEHQQPRPEAVKRVSRGAVRRAADDGFDVKQLAADRVGALGDDFHRPGARGRGTAADGGERRHGVRASGTPSSRRRHRASAIPRARSGSSARMAIRSGNSQQRRRRPGRLEERGEHVVDRRRVGVGLEDRHRGRVDPMRRQRREIASTRLREGHRRPPRPRHADAAAGCRRLHRQHREPPVAEPGEVLGGEPRRRHVVDADDRTRSSVSPKASATKGSRRCAPTATSRWRPRGRRGSARRRARCGCSRRARPARRGDQRQADAVLAARLGDTPIIMVRAKGSRRSRRAAPPSPRRSRTAALSIRPRGSGPACRSPRRPRHPLPDPARTNCGRLNTFEAVAFGTPAARRVDEASPLPCSAIPSRRSPQCRPCPTRRFLEPVHCHLTPAAGRYGLNRFKCRCATGST